MPPARGSRVVRVLLALGVLLALAQLARPDRTTPAKSPEKSVERLATVPPGVQATLRRACYDCHSNEPRWPWYSQVSPVSFFVVGHVREAREHLNFSDWSHVAAGEDKDALEEICDEVQKGGMPLPSYLWIHWDARLSPADVEAICAWTTAEDARLTGTAESRP